MRFLSQQAGERASDHADLVNITSEEELINLVCLKGFHVQQILSISREGSACMLLEDEKKGVKKRSDR